MIDYLPVFLLIAIALALSVGMIVASALLGPRRKTGRKLSAYECGMSPKGDTRHPFLVSYYLTAMIFILFDVEVIFMYPWAVTYLNMAPMWFGLIEMVFFILILVAGYFYAWKKGAFEWD